MSSSKFSVFIALSCFLSLYLLQIPALAIKRSYIVYLGDHSHEDSDSNLDKLDQRVSYSHQKLLASTLGSKVKARDAIYNSYHNYINGFAALLEEEDAAKIAQHPNVVSVILDQRRKLQTTNTWDLLMQNKNGVIQHDSLWRKANFGEDVIIANLDTGVWPESRSFSDKGYGVVPTKWKGKCVNKTIVPCNKKLIGARYFSKGYEEGVVKLNASMRSARDHDGHGSHTLSTAAGNFVSDAKVFDFDAGTAKGGSPRAHVAAYKVCWPMDMTAACYESDILEGFDWAIHDRVDVLSVSVGGDATDYFNDVIAIGAFHAVKNGIVVVCAGGNDGPKMSTVSNVAPWILTVGASTISREFQSYVNLENGKHLKGASLSKPLPEKKYYPLINSADVKASNASAKNALLCEAGTLDPQKVKGKILVCLSGGIGSTDKSTYAGQAGAVGMILCNDNVDGDYITADPHIIPTSHLTYKDCRVLYAYLNSTKHPLGYIAPPFAQLGKTRAPSTSDFSSRGPNRITPDILKPDVTAPGVNIIAAFAEDVHPLYDNRTTSFDNLEGTSMACPHVSGVVGLLKKLHPDWSGAAIKSAIMTTAGTRDNTNRPMLDQASGKEATPYSYGSGHIQPNQAMDPGLVYDLSINDYLDFLCGSGYNSTMIKKISNENYKCPANYNLLNFNYPSITIGKLSAAGTAKVIRKLKNVGTPGTYHARVHQPLGVSVSVSPSTLTFHRVGEEKKFELIMETKTSKGSNHSVFGDLLWSDGKHYVRSPIVVSSIVAKV